MFGLMQVLEKVKTTFDVPIVTDVHDASQCEYVGCDPTNPLNSPDPGAYVSCLSKLWRSHAVDTPSTSRSHNI